MGEAEEVAAGSSPVLDLGQASVQGRRARNEDFHGAVIPDEALRRLGVLVCIADGIGGSADGRMAAEMTVRGLLNDYYATPMSWSGLKAVHRVAESLNGWLFSEGRKLHRGLGTTLVAALFRGRTLSVLSVGDSRLYRLRAGRLDLLTRDHVFGGPEMEVLTKAVGIDDRFTPDTAEEPLAAGDRYVLVTDGVWRDLPPDGFLDLAAAGTAQAAADALTAAAIAGGGTDNATAVVVDVRALPPAGVADVVREWTGLPMLPPPRPGETVDGFRILRRLHAGHQGVVLAAVDERTGRDVALKFPDLLAAADPAWLERFAREEWAGLKVNHPNVVRVLSQPPGRRQACYYVLEYLEGQSLGNVLAAAGGTGLPPDQVAGWLGQAARGLMALHRRGLIHRDVKPDNLFLLRDGRLVVLDFGTVRIEGLAPIAADRPGRRVVGGTSGFMAPELYRGERGDPSTDLFALGVTGYRLLTGRMPFGEPESNVAPRFDPPPPLREARPDTPPGLASAVERCLSPSADGRPGDAGELLAWLGDPTVLAPPRFVPLIDRIPPRFYRIGFWVLLVAIVMGWLACRGG